jgi:hypothetical protein
MRILIGKKRFPNPFGKQEDAWSPLRTWMSVYTKESATAPHIFIRSEEFIGAKHRLLMKFGCLGCLFLYHSRGPTDCELRKEGLVQRRAREARAIGGSGGYFLNGLKGMWAHVRCKGDIK